MKILGSTISFTHLPLDQALSELAAIGFSQVDILCAHNWAHLNLIDIVGIEEEKASEIQSMLDGLNMNVLAMNGAVSHKINTKGEAEQGQVIEEAKALGKLARHLDVSRLTFQPGSKEAGDSLEESLQLCVQIFSRVVDAIGGDDLAVSFEPHCNSIVETYEAMKVMLDEVSGLTVTYDPSHFIMMGWDLRESEFLFERTSNVHLRDAVNGNLQVPMGEGEVDFKWVIDGLKANGYDDSISLEYIHSEEQDVTKDKLKLRELLEELLQ